MNVLVVESPAKAKTINKYLGTGYKVLASFGHIRDLPSKDGSVKPDDDFSMVWEVDARAQAKIKDIAAAVKGADKLILATDPDREGEAISWHILEVLQAEDMCWARCRSSGWCSTPSPNRRSWKPSPIPARSTKNWWTPIWRAARWIIWSALRCRRCCGANCRARVRPAGCRSVALRLVVERETEIEAFKAQEYWSIDADVCAESGDFAARLIQLDGKKLEKLSLGNEADAKRAVAAIKAQTFTIGSVESQAGQAQSLAALHHLDPAAGSRAQAGLQRQAHHAGGAGPL